MKIQPRQILIVFLAMLAWAAVYVNQEFDFTRLRYNPGQYGQGYIPEGEEWRFAVNKSIRFFLNDFISLVFIYGLFQSVKYVKVALWVMGFGMFILLPTYLIFAILYKEEAFNVLTFLHRITMNPWLMLLLVPAFFYQKMEKKAEAN
ncbi:MAG: exosortase F system-associated protein [Bacteroidetes bacterium]|nr:MAG: exosortase F system-associated protein [Bacteroidota bacterium]